MLKGDQEANVEIVGVMGEAGRANGGLYWVRGRGALGSTQLRSRRVSQGKHMPNAHRNRAHFTTSKLKSTCTLTLREIADDTWQCRLQVVQRDTYAGSGLSHIVLREYRLEQLSACQSRPYAHVNMTDLTGILLQITSWLY